MERNPCVYMLANRRQGALYIGVTSDLAGRIYQHREGLTPGFTSTYGIARLVWFEAHATMAAAIQREKQMKKWNRAWKIELIAADNPDWDDLAVTVLRYPLIRHPRESGDPSPERREMGPRFRGDDESL